MAPRAQRERSQEMLAELPVPWPRCSIFPRPEGQCVDEDGSRTDELDVECTGVAQNQIPRERSFLHCERQQGRRLQLSETPFVGIADEGKTFRPDDRRCRRRARNPEVHFLMRDQESFSREL